MTSQATAEVASKVTAEIQKAGRSKSWTAQASGIPLTTFLRKTKADSDFTVSEVVRVAAVLGIPPSRIAPSAFFSSSDVDAA